MINIQEKHGLLLVDKPTGMTSHDVVAQLRKILKTKAVGHTGTLDPLASGLMVCLLNEGTKLSQYILDGDKGYQLKAQLGVETDTLDLTGQVLKSSPVGVTTTDILVAAQQQVGDFHWPVPIYSAVKVQGQKLYEYARAQEEVEIPQKMMRFWQLENPSINIPEVAFSVRCSKGSFIRTWVDQLGKKLGTGAALSELRRTYSAPYEVHQAVSLSDLLENFEEAFLKAFLPLERALPFVKIVRVKGQDEKLLKNGQISHDLRSRLIVEFNPLQDHLIQIHSQESQKLLALIGIQEGKGLAIRRVFQ